MIDFTVESPLTLTAATKLPELARDGRRPDPSTIWRWATRGIRGIRLETKKVGGLRCTSREAVHRFMEALTDDEPQVVESPPPGRRRRAIAAANAELDAAGV